MSNYFMDDKISLSSPSLGVILGVGSCLGVGAILGILSSIYLCSLLSMLALPFLVADTQEENDEQLIPTKKKQKPALAYAKRENAMMRLVALPVASVTFN
jgi:hypothetical protein